MLNWGKIFFHPSSEMKNRGVFQQTRLSFESDLTIRFCFSFKVRSNFNFTFNFEMRFHESASLSCNCISAHHLWEQLVTQSPLALCYTSI